MRQVILDTETTGLLPARGHRIIEIGCLEMINRQLTGEKFHVYINPQRAVDPGAAAVHGIRDEFLQDKPLFSDISAEFIKFINGAELIIHNAPFDVGFLDNEIKLLKDKSLNNITSMCQIYDTLAVARKKHPGQRNNLDALCKRYNVNNSHRDLHGALLDAEILADVYLGLTAGQISFNLSAENSKNSTSSIKVSVSPLTRSKDHKLHIIRATEEEVAKHDEFFE